jgi:hypothetical protein
MKSLQLLWNVLAQECASICCTSAAMDCKTVDSRIKHEGLSFLTITLPEFGKDLQKGLDRGQVDRSLFSSFKRKGELPRFLGGYLDLVFDRTSGRLLDQPDIDAIRSIRQLTLGWSKISIPCTRARERDAMNGFVKCEQDVRAFDKRLTRVDSLRFQQMSAMLFGSVFSKIDRKVYDGEIIPRHGPGKTADRLLGNKKFMQRNWTERLEEVFHFGDFLFPSPSYYDKYEEVNILEPGSEIPVKVVSVPKTQKTPRIIAIEPTAMQYAQQGLLHEVVGELERDDFLSNVLGFSDQTPNQRMAESGSSNGDLATLDLSEASDRVSNQLIRIMTGRHPHLHAAVDATRSRKADVPGHGVIRLSKFASMGSALCFPFEAMAFLTMVFIGIEESLNRPLAPKDIYSFRDKVRIYGDDIIVPVDHVQAVVFALEHFGAQVNKSKSYWNGKFRESCGKEYFDGHDVSIVKIRQLLPTQQQDATEVISTVSTRNLLYWAGYWQTARWLDAKLSRVLNDKYPLVSSTSPVLGRESVLGYDTQKISTTTHSPLVRGFVVSVRTPFNRLDDSGALLKYFLKRTDKPFFDRNHLERSGRPQAVHIKLRWSSPF